MNLWGVTEAGLAEKLRRDNYDQFNVLVKMHLSFVLDFNTEDGPPGDKSKLKKWPFYKKNKHCSKGVVEGAPLTQEGICQVYQLIEFLKREQNITTEGIFRRTGSLSRQQDLKNLLMQGTSLNFEGSNFNVHDCASVLKGFLAELPEPLLTDGHFPIFCQLAELFSSSSERALPEVRLLTALQLLVLLLPAENRAFLKDILELLNLTTLHESLNKMCSDSLATLFTPHLLCPRNLSPENLHVNSQNLSGIVSFMIRKWKELFEIPAKLGVDIKAYYKQQEIKMIMLRSSPITIDHRDNINESACDTAKTVYSFVDHEKTAKENQANPTETALAQLYAHIQCMPESSKKRKLIKQFNKENGHGVPLQLLKCGGGGGGSGGISSSSDNNNHHHRRRSSSQQSSSSTATVGGNSIKKLKTLAKAIKLNGFGNQHQRSYSEELIVDRAVNSCEMSTVKTRLFCTGYACENNSSCSDEVNINNEEKKPPTVSGFGNSNCDMSGKRSSKSNLDVNASLCMDFAATSTPAMYNHHHHYKDYFQQNQQQQQQQHEDEQQCACTSEAFTPNGELRRRCGECQSSSSMSPITRSTRRMSKTMQETMMTPRSRRPVLVVSRTNLASLPKFKKFHNSKNTKSMEELMRESESTTCPSMIKYTSGRGGGTLLRRSKSTSSLQDNDDDITSTIEKDDDGNHHYTSSLTDTFKQYFKDKHNIYVNSNNCKDLIMMDLSENKTTIPNKITSSSIKYLEDHDDNDASSFDSSDENYEKQLVLRPRLFDENGKPIVYETSF